MAYDGVWRAFGAIADAVGLATTETAILLPPLLSEAVGRRSLPVLSRGRFVNNLHPTFYIDGGLNRISRIIHGDSGEFVAESGLEALLERCEHEHLVDGVCVRGQGTTGCVSAERRCLQKGQ